ncbi:MAG: SurA N-terminal domain-containing protein [Candidatus Beckwithbacteria bacterium]|nr:SurA N-terminal domain-containing protein [Patescibacteria group bacterium]
MKKQKKSKSSKKCCFKKFEGCKKFCGKNWKKFLVLVGILGLLVYFKSMIVVSFVNNQPIFRCSYIKELEAQGGKQILDTMITKALILQEAKKKGIEVSREEIDTELVRIEEIAKQQGMGLDELLESQNVKRDDLIKQIEIQKIVEKLAGEGIAISDEEANLYLEENADFLPEDSTPEELMNIAKEQLIQQQLNSSIQEMILKLKDEAKIVSWL